MLGDHRVRFLCFLGIARDDRFCGYILDSGEIKGEHCYRFHGFTKEPNTDKLCLVLHNAYLARYRRVMQSQAVRDAGTQDKQVSRPQLVTCLSHVCEISHGLSHLLAESSRERQVQKQVF